MEAAKSLAWHYEQHAFVWAAGDGLPQLIALWMRGGNLYTYEQSLKALAHKYIWWKTPDEAVATPDRVMAQVMNIGDYDDVQVLAKLVGDDVLRDVLAHAEAGWFNERSWAYWHYRLDLATLDNVPPLPVRSFGDEKG